MTASLENLCVFNLLQNSIRQKDAGAHLARLQISDEIKTKIQKIQIDKTRVI